MLDHILVFERWQAQPLVSEALEASDHARGDIGLSPSLWRKQIAHTGRERVCQASILAIDGDDTRS